MPVAEGRVSVVAVLDAGTARPATGAWVEFIGRIDNGTPERVGAVGFVRGRRDDVFFAEISASEAAGLALARRSRNVRFVQIAAPEPAAVDARRVHADNAQPVTLAPRLRTIAVSLAVSDDPRANLDAGHVLTFPGFGESIWRPTITGEMARSRDVKAMFVAARKAGASRFDITLVAEPRDAFTLIRTAARGKLTIAPPKADAPPEEAEPKCYIRHRRGVETTSTEIPCEK